MCEWHVCVSGTNICTVKKHSLILISVVSVTSGMGKIEGKYIPNCNLLVSPVKVFNKCHPITICLSLSTF